MITAPTSIVTSPIKFTAPEKARLAAAAAELARLDGLLEQIVHIKPVIDRAAEDFAAGRITIREAIGLLAASGDSAARAELESRLRRPAKAAIKEAVASVGDLIAKARQHHISELAAKATALEKGDRATLDGLGMHPDEFRPSDLLRGIREQHRRALADSSQPPGRDALNRLLAAVFPARAELASDVLDLESDHEVLAGDFK